MDDSPVEKISRAYAEALLSGDEVAAEVAIREALAARLSSAEIDEQIIAPALWLIGELWQRHEITVAEEHIATEISLRTLALQREALRLQGGRREHLVMLASPSGELHGVALWRLGSADPLPFIASRFTVRMIHSSFKSAHA